MGYKRDVFDGEDVVMAFIRKLYKRRIAGTQLELKFLCEYKFGSVLQVHFCRVRNVILEKVTYFFSSILLFMFVCS